MYILAISSSTATLTHFSALYYVCCNKRHGPTEPIRSVSRSACLFGLPIYCFRAPTETSEEEKIRRVIYLRRIFFKYCSATLLSTIITHQHQAHWPPPPPPPPPGSRITTFTRAPRYAVEFIIRRVVVGRRMAKERVEITAIAAPSLLADSFISSIDIS